MKDEMVEEELLAASRMARTTIAVERRKKKGSSLSSSTTDLSKTQERKKSDKKKKKTKDKKKSCDDKKKKEKDFSSGRAKSKKNGAMVLAAPSEVTEYLDEIFQTAFESCPQKKQLSSTIKRVEVRFYLKSKTGKHVEKESHDDSRVGRSDKDRNKSKNKVPKKKKKKTKDKEKKSRICDATNGESGRSNANKSGSVGEILPSSHDDHCFVTITSFPGDDSENRLIGTSVTFAKPSDTIPIDITISQVGQGIYSTYGSGMNQEKFEPTISPLVVVPVGENTVLSSSPKSPRVPVDLNDEAMSISAPPRGETFKTIDDVMIGDHAEDEPDRSKKFNWILQKKLGRPWYVRNCSGGDNVSLLADYDYHKGFETTNVLSVNGTPQVRSPTMPALPTMGSLIDRYNQNPDASQDFRMDKVIDLNARANHQLTMDDSPSLVADDGELNPDRTKEENANHAALMSNRRDESPLKQEGYTLERILSLAESRAEI